MRSPPPECCRRGEGECAHARERCGQTQRDGERCTSARHRWGGEKSECDGSQRVRDGAHVAARNRAPGSTRGNAGAYALPAVRGARRAVLADIRAPHARLRPRALLVRPGRSRASPPTRPIHRHRRGGARVGHALPRASQRACAEWRARPRLRPPTSQTSQPGWGRHWARATRRATPRGTQQRCAAPRHPSRAPRRRWGARAPAACPTPLPTPGTLPRVHTPARPPALDRRCKRARARAQAEIAPPPPPPPGGHDGGSRVQGPQAHVQALAERASLRAARGGTLCAAAWRAGPLRHHRCDFPPHTPVCAAIWRLVACTCMWARR